MLKPTVANKFMDSQQHHNIVVGDILLHSEATTSIIQVILHSRPVTPSAMPDRPMINRVSPNSCGTTSAKAIVGCDLKNTGPAKLDSEKRKKSSSKKKLMNVHKASVAFVKELKAKVTNSNHIELKSYATNTNNDTQKTYL